MIWTKRDYLIAIVVLGLGLTAGLIVRAVIHNRIQAETEATIPALTSISGPLTKDSNSYRVEGYILKNTSPSLNLDQFIGQRVRVKGFKDGQILNVTALEKI